MTYEDFARRGRNGAGWTVLTVIAAGLLTLGLGVGLTVPLMLGHALPSNVQRAMTGGGDPVIFFVATGVTFSILLGAMAGAARVVQAKTFTDLVGRWSWGAFIRGAVSWLAALVVLSAVDFALAPASFRFTGSAATLRLVTVALPALTVQTFAEEFVFRGYVTQTALLALKRPLPAALVSALVFASVHIPNGWPQAANAFVVGLVLAGLAMRSGGLGFGYGLHLVNNSFGALVVVSESDVFKGVPGLITQRAAPFTALDAVLGILALALVALGEVHRLDKIREYS